MDRSNSGWVGSSEKSDGIPKRRKSVTKARQEKPIPVSQSIISIERSIY